MKYIFLVELETDEEMTPEKMERNISYWLNVENVKAEVVTGATDYHRAKGVIPYDGEKSEEVIRRARGSELASC